MLRIIAAGVFDRYPHLHLISGHWGEMVPNFLERLDEFTGMVGTGTDHVLWAEDFPFLQRQEQVGQFLEDAPQSEHGKEQIAHLNAEQLFRL